MKYVIIDVREPNEYQSGHVKGARNIPPDMLLTDTTILSDVPKNTPLIVYCRTGSRSNVAMNILQQMGYKNVTNGINKDHVDAHLINL